MANVKKEETRPTEVDDKALIQYKMQLSNERDNLDPGYEHASKLLLSEIERIEGGGNMNDKTQAQPRAADVINIRDDKGIKLSCAVKIPESEGRGFNYVGKLLGPKGASLKQLQMHTQTKMSILGRGSMKDRAKEEELRKEGGKYAHLNDILHVKVEVFAQPWEAYSRLSTALIELHKQLQPEMSDPAAMGMDPRQMYGGPPENGMGGPPMGRGRGGPPGGDGRGGYAPRGRGEGLPPSRGGPAGRGMAPDGGRGRGGPPRGGPGGPIPGGRGRGAPGRGGVPSGPPSRGGPPRGGMSPRGGAPSRGGPGRGAPRGGPTAPGRGAPSPTFNDFAAYDRIDSYATQGFADDPYADRHRESSREPIREPIREAPRDPYGEPPRDSFREAPPRDRYREEPGRESRFEPPTSRDSGAYYDYGHGGSSSADTYADAYGKGDRSWESGSKSQPASRSSSKSYRSTSSYSRPY